MQFRHQDQDTKRKNISKLENRILEKGSLLHECCVKRKGSLGVTFFPCVYVCLFVHKFWEIARDGWIWQGLVNYNCDASYDHLWCPNGPEVDQKCPSVRLSIPNTSLTSLTNLMRGIYKRRALAPCDFY